MEYKIGSFNMKNWGRNAKKDFSKIAEIIVEEELDVVALQEILSEGKSLEQFVKQELYNWDFCWAHPHESQDIEKLTDMIVKDTRGEGYAFLWNKRKFKLMEFSKLGKTRVFEPRIISNNDVGRGIDCTSFARTPYYIRLQPLYGGFFELRLIDIHIYYGSKSRSDIEKRRMEFDILTQKIYPAINQKRYGQNRAVYTIAMGDYNLNIFSPNVQTSDKNCYLTEVYSYNDGKKNVQILTVQDQLTTLKDVENDAETENETDAMYANNYDHFTYSPELSSFVNVSYETVDAVGKYCNGDHAYYNKNISDHLPIVMTVEI